MVERHPSTYILASGRAGTLHVGVTSKLLARVHQHRTGDVPGFPGRYGVKGLVYHEVLTDMSAATAREKQLKAWRRDWKLNLIEAANPECIDLAIELGLAPLSASAET